MLQAACLARCNGSRVDVYLYGDVGVEQFREMVKEACSSGGQHIIVSYSRKEFLQTGECWLKHIGKFCLGVFGVAMRGGSTSSSPTRVRSSCRWVRGLGSQFEWLFKNP